MSAQRNKFFEYFSITDFSELDAKESVVESRFNKAREKVAILDDFDKVDDIMREEAKIVEKYLVFARKWLEDERQNVVIKDSADGIALKKVMYQAIKDLEPKIATYVQTDLLLAHYYYVSKEFVKREEEHVESVPKMDWTSDTELFVDKYLKAVPLLKQEIARYEQAFVVLEKLENELDDFEKNIQSLFGKTTANTIFTNFKSGIRQMNVNKGEQAIHMIDREKGKITLIPGRPNKAKTAKQGKALLKTYIEARDVLKLDDDRLFLKKNEVKVAYDVAKKELAQALDIIQKYHHPFLKSRCQKLYKLQTQLNDIGSLLEILEIYRMGIRSILVQVGRFEDVRMLDTTVKTPLEYLVYTKMEELENIQDKAKSIMQGLKAAVQNRLSQMV